jgi:hypothetical protein
VVRVHGPGDHGLAETWAGVDHDFIPAASNRVGCEHHASRDSVDHSLDNDGQRDAAVINAVGIAVADGTISP